MFFNAITNRRPDLTKKIICFSGDDERTSPDDPKYLEDIASAIIKSNCNDKYQILLRRCPVDMSGRFNNVLNKNQNLKNVIKLKNRKKCRP